MAGLAFLHRHGSWPVIQDLVGDPDPPTLGVLERRLAESGVELAKAVPLLAAQIGLNTEGSYPPLELVPEAQRPRLLLTLLDYLLGLAARRPLLIVLEDSHWADATTLELTQLLLNRIADAPVLLVITSRPEGMPPLHAQTHLTSLTLSRLGRNAVAEIVARLLPGQKAQPTLLKTIIHRTDGVPLFVEELTKALAEQGRTNDVDLSDFNVPASLHDTLMARLDCLDTSKDVAQLAACIGREVDFRLLAAVADRSETELRRNLDELCAAELLFRRGTPPDATYVFKHALVRDAAYESLLKSRRRATHERLLEAIERDSPKPATEQAAYHAAGAELWVKAMRYYGAAGKAAIDRASNAEGIALIAKALEAGAHIDSDPATEAAMIDLRRTRGWAYLTVGETERMLEELSEAERRADGFGMARLTCQLRTQRTHIESIFGQADRAIMHGRDAMRIAGPLAIRSCCRLPALCSVIRSGLWATIVRALRSSRWMPRTTAWAFALLALGAAGSRCRRSCSSWRLSGSAWPPGRGTRSRRRGAGYRGGGGQHLGHERRQLSPRACAARQRRCGLGAAAYRVEHRIRRASRTTNGFALAAGKFRQRKSVVGPP